MQTRIHPDWSFNHIAGRCSVWPLLIVSGPIVDKLGINTGVWALGGGDRASMTIGRALSLLLWNCLEVSPATIQRGSLGNAGRFAACLAERTDSAWDPNHMQEGFAREDSAVTVTSVYSECGRGHYEILDPHLMVEQMTRVGFNLFYKTHYVVNLGPEGVDYFASQGWTKEDVRQYLLENTRRSVAELKRSGRWAWNDQELHGVTAADLEVLPGDEEKMVYLFKPDIPEEYRKYLFDGREGRPDIFIVCAGGDSGFFYDIRTGHSKAVSAVTRPIKLVA
jgi:hypothetical protein